MRSGFIILGILMGLTGATMLITVILAPIAIPLIIVGGIIFILGLLMR